MNLTPTPLRRTLGSACALAAAALLLVGCSSGAAAKPEANAAGGTEATVPTLKAGTLSCAMSGEFRPFNYYDESAEVAGVDVDFCRAIAAELGLEAEPVTGAFNTLVAGLQANRFDTVIGSMTATEERKTQVAFTEPYYETGTALFVGEDSPITGPEDLDNAVLGVALGSVYEEQAHKLDGVAEIKTYQGDADALRDVVAGRIDGAVTQEMMGAYLAKNAKMPVVAVGERLFPDSASIAVNQDNPELLAAVSKALATIQANGTADAIVTEWFGEQLQ